MGNIVACEECGKEYEPVKLLRGLCPVCLLAQTLPDGESVCDPNPKTGGIPPVRFLPPGIRELAPHFPQLEIEGLAGHGGMSCVYKVRQTHLNRTVALKLLPQEIADSVGGLERFQREAKMLAQLRHPNIVEIHDAGQAGPWCFILMEYVAGPNLRQLLGESRLPSSDVLRIASGICDGLQYAHDQGVVHRDVKPENVLLDSAGNVKLVDFGLAKLLKPLPSHCAASRTGHVMGTPHYMAPEQVETPSSVDHRADVYSLGVLIYEMLTGELPLGHFEPPSQRIGSDPAFDAVVLQAMSKDPMRRYQRARDVQAGMAFAEASKTGTRLADQRPAWRRLVNELFLSACSILATVFGGLNLTKAMAPEILSSFPQLTSLANAVLAFLIGFLLARVNVSSKARWRDLSLAQNLCVPILVTAYALMGGVLLIGPGLAVLLFGTFPLFANLEHWSFFGSVFGKLDRASFLTSYWLRIYGAGALTCAAWCILLAFAVRARPALVRRIFHPSDEHTGSAITRLAALLGAAILAPVGTVLIYASWLGSQQR